MRNKIFISILILSIMMLSVIIPVFAFSPSNDIIKADLIYIGEVLRINTINN